jgi:hypothetical protein
MHPCREKHRTSATTGRNPPKPERTQPLFTTMRDIANGELIIFYGERTRAGSLKAFIPIAVGLERWAAHFHIPRVREMLAYLFWY